MKIVISESQYQKIIVESFYDNLTKNALNCGYRNSDEYKKNNYKCPSKLLINAKKCGWSSKKDQPAIYRYLASNFRCNKNKPGKLSIDEQQTLKDLMYKYGIQTKPKSILNPRSYAPKFIKDIEKQLSDLKDRPDLVKKNYCNPHCISNEVSCFIAVVRNNLDKIKKKLGGGVTNSDIEMLMKIAVALVAWQSNYGKSDRLYDIEPQKIMGFEIHPYDVYQTILGPTLLKQYVKYKKISEPNKNISEPSFGPAEFQISTWEKTGIEDMFGYDISSLIGSCLGLMVTTWDAYKKAKSLGLSSGPSKNELASKNGFWPNGINGTGNHLWDIAISIQSWPKDKMLIKYCKTDNPLFAGPCSQDYYEPFKTENTWKEWKKSTPQLISYYSKNDLKFPGKAKVLKNAPILDYYPMLRGGQGDMGAQNDSKTMLEFVSGKMKKYECVSLVSKQKIKKVVDDTSFKNPTPNRGGIA